MALILKKLKATFVQVKKNKKKSFNEKLGAFSVKIDSLAAANEILDKAQAFGLKIQKVPGNKVIATKGESSLAFFFSDNNYDVEYVDSKIESKIRKLVPRYSAKDDKYGIICFLRKASEEKKALRAELKVRGLTLRALTQLKKKITKKYGKTVSYIDFLRQPLKTRKSKHKDTYIEVSEHYVQIGTKFYAKNPNDVILFNGNYIR